MFLQTLSMHSALATIVLPAFIVRQLPVAAMGSLAANPPAPTKTWSTEAVLRTSCAAATGMATSHAWLALATVVGRSVPAAACQICSAG